MAIELTTATIAQLSGIRQALGVFNPRNVFPNADVYYSGGSGLPSTGSFQVGLVGTIINFLPLQDVNRIDLSNGGTNLTSFLNAHVLVNLQNLGTVPALNLQECDFSASTLNQLFTDLPATTKTATINVINNPGAATCDTTIATNKGYTVVTS